ncbi:hypothetical protein DTO271G3_6233 [Paecilomyces variotii]|nr:hypothetical protein DTO271G3_6233 [Paecilomyces variotii]
MVYMGSRGPALIAASPVLLILAATAVVLRIISSHIRRKSFKVHDYLVFLSLFCLTGYVIDVLIGAIEGGYGDHILDMPLDKLKIALKVFFVTEWLWSTAVATFRLAILALYAEIFQTTIFYWVALGTGTVVFLYWVASIFTIGLLCRPVAYNWDRTIPGVCGDVIKTEYASAGFNMAIDLWVVFLPLPIVWRMHMTSRKKLGVTGAFALGVITAGINLGRAIQTRVCPYDDLTYCALDSSILCVAEMTAGILVACVPTFGSVLSRRKKEKSLPRYNDAPPTIGSKRRRDRPIPASFDMLDDDLLIESPRIESPNKDIESGKPGGGRRPSGIVVTRDLDVSSIS